MAKKTSSSVRLPRSKLRCSSMRVRWICFFSGSSSHDKLFFDSRALQSARCLLKSVVHLTISGAYTRESREATGVRVREPEVPANLRCHLNPSRGLATSQPGAHQLCVIPWRPKLPELRVNDHLHHVGQAALGQARASI